MSTVGKAAAVLALGVSVSLLMPIAGKAQEPSLAERCEAQVEALWPQDNMEVMRTKADLVRVCMQNGGRIPG